MEIQRKLNSLFISYKRDLKQAISHSKEAQKILIDYYTEERINKFNTWDELLTDINFICYSDLGIGKLIAIKIIKDKYENRINPNQ